MDIPRDTSPRIHLVNVNIAIGLLLGIAVLYLGREILIPIALSVLLSFLLAPAMIRLQRWGLGRKFAAFIVVLLAFSTVAITSWVVLGQAYNLLRELPRYRHNIQSKIRAVNFHGLGEFGKVKQTIDEVSRQFANQNRPSATVVDMQGDKPALSRLSQSPIPVEVHEPEPTAFEFLRNAAGSVLRPLATAFIVLVFVIFMLLGWQDLRDRILRLGGKGRLHVTTQALDDAARRVSRYLLMQLAVNTAFGFSVGLGLLLIGIPHPLVWAVLAIVLRFVPYIGPWLAAIGPILLATAVATGWHKLGLTLGLYLGLELLISNLAEPFLYGTTVGVSAIAILLGAVFWTWLWGPAGLLLSTPLTVCIVVIGRYVPHLEVLGILFGDEPVLSPAQRFYQRMIALDAEDAAEVIEQLLKDQSLVDIYDSVIVPALSMAEQGRHDGFLDGPIEEYFLDNTSDLVEELGSRQSAAFTDNHQSAKLICLPAKDKADEIAAKMLIQLLPASVIPELVPRDLSTADLVRRMTSQKPHMVCISGVPPQTTRHVALRCRHLRKHFPDLTIIAAVWSSADLASIRSRIPVSDANHVVCTFKQAVDYIAPVIDEVSAEQHHVSEGEEPQQSSELKVLDTLDVPLQDVLDRFTQELAKALDAPIALLNLHDEHGSSWKVKCGLPVDLAADPGALTEDTDHLWPQDRSTRVIEDVSQDDRLAQNTFLLDKGIHFLARAPLVSRSGKLVGSLHILDTRPRKITEAEKERLQTAALAVTEAVELRTVAPQADFLRDK